MCNHIQLYEDDKPINFSCVDRVLDVLQSSREVVINLKKERISDRGIRSFTF